MVFRYQGTDMQPYLSAVMVGRNDSYGGNFVQRLQTSLGSLTVLADRYGLELEIVLVEWNPPADNAPLKEVIEIPDHAEDVSLKIIQVPNEMHEQIPNSDSFPLFEYRGKNVGIRRSSGKFVLATNPDIIFSEELISHIAQQSLDSGSFYRINRHDVDGALEGLSAYSVDELLDVCSENVIRELGYDGSKIHRFDLLRRMGFSHFIRNPRELRRPFRLLRERVFGSTEQRTENDERPLAAGSVSAMHTAAAGDFLLLSQNGWEDIRGFPEMDTNLHADSYGVITAASRGYEQRQFMDPLRIYHQEHERERLDRVEDGPEQEEIRREGKKILRGEPETVVNDANWGLPDVDLPMDCPN